MSFPELEDYPSTQAWLEAIRDQTLMQMLNLKAAINSVRDDFIGLEDPTQEQAEWYRKTEHRVATCMGQLKAILNQAEAGLRLPGRAGEGK